MPKLQVLVDESAEAGSSGTLEGTLSRSGLAGRVKALDTSVLKESASALVSELSSVFSSLREVGDFNLKAVTSPEVAVEHRPGVAMVTYSWVGLVLLGGTGVVFVISLLW